MKLFAFDQQGGFWLHVQSIKFFFLFGIALYLSWFPDFYSIQITIEYCANSEGEANFNIGFGVEFMLAPLNLNVKAQGYLLKASVTYLKECESVKKLRHGCFEEVDFGKARYWFCIIDIICLKICIIFSIYLIGNWKSINFYILFSHY